MDALDRRSFLRAAALAGLFPLPATLDALKDPASPLARSLAKMGDSPLSPFADDYPLRPVRCDQVEITDGFWRPRMEVNRSVSLDYCFDRIRPAEEFHFTKLIEAAGYMLEDRPDAELEARVDEHVDALLAELEGRIRGGIGR